MSKKLSISLATAFLMISGGAYADGNITGTVFNKTTSEPLDFATVVMVNPETGARSLSANGREVAHYVWPSPIPSANPTVVSIIATTTSTPVATEKSIIIKLIPPTGRG